MRRPVPRPRGHTSLGVLARAAVVLGAVLGVAAPAAGAVGPDDTTQGSADDTTQAPDGVVLVGVGGLQWTDVDRAVTPTLWRMLSQGSVGSISVRTAEPETCRVDGWLTLSAARRILGADDEQESTPAGTSSPGQTPSASPAGPGADDAAGCRPVPEVVLAPGDTGPRTAAPADVAGWAALVGAPDEETGTPGMLAERLVAAGTCATAVGPGAAVALADRAGHLERYVAEPDDLDVVGRAALRRCPVLVIDAGEPATEPDLRQSELRALDDRLAALTDAIADDTRVVVAGVHDTPIDELGLQVVIDWRKGTTSAGWLQSASTRRPGLVTLTDLSATVLEAAGAEFEDLEGSPLSDGGDRRMSPERTVENRRYLVELTTTVPHLMPVFVAVLGVLGAAALAVLLLARRRTGAAARASVPPSVPVRTARAALLLCAAAPAGAYLAALSRWWGAQAPTVVASAWTVGAALACALTAWCLSRLVRPGFWRVGGAVAALTWLVLVVDGVTGTTLQHGSLLGVSTTLGGRYYGFGNLTFAVLLTVALVLAGALASAAVARGRRGLAVAAIVAVGLVTVVVDGWPGFGADFGGMLAVVPAFAVLLLSVAQAPPTPRRVVLTVAVTLGTVGLVSVVDWIQPGGGSHLGLFVQRLVDGQAWPVIAGKAAGAWQTIANPLGAVATVGCVVVAALVAGPARWRPRPVTDLYGRVPLLRAVVLAAVLGALLGTVLNDSGIAVGGTVLALLGGLLVSSWADAWAGAVGPAGAVPAQPAEGTGPTADERPSDAHPAGASSVALTWFDTPARLVAVAGGLLSAMLLGSVAAPGMPVAAGDVATGGPALVRDGDHVVLIGTSGLRWEDVDRAATPTLWRLLRDGAAPAGVAVGVTGSSRRCDTAGWLSLSAGRAPVTGSRATGTWVCAPWAVVPRSAGVAADVVGWDSLTALQRTSGYRPRLGVLAEALEDAGACATAVGPGAALALAGDDGRVSRYRDLGTALSDGTFGVCPVTIVDAGAAPLRAPSTLTPDPVTEFRPEPTQEQRDEQRAAEVAAVDATVRRVMAAAPEDAVVLVMDVGDPSAPRPGLGVGLGLPTGDAARYLSVPSTRWEGVVRLLDAPTTLLQAVGSTNPPEFTGAGLVTGGVRPSDTGAVADQLAQLSVRDLALRRVSGSITSTPMFLGLALLAVAVLLGSRRVRAAGARRTARVVDAVLLVLASMPAGLFAMSTWFWWRGTAPTLDMWLCLAASTLTIAGVGALAPRKPAWAAPGIIATITFGVLTVDALLGTPLHRGSPLGPAPALGGRYYGFGNPTYSVYVVAAVVAVAAVASWLLARGWRRAALVVAVLMSGVALVVDLWPTLGADVGGGLVLLPVLAVLVLAVATVRVSVRRLAVIGLAGLVLVAGIGVVDWLRPADQRSHLGRFVQSVMDRTAWETVSRKAGFALSSLTDGATAWLTLVLVLALALVLWRRAPLRAAWLDRLEASWPLARPMLVTLLLAAVGGAAVNDYGIRIATIMLFAAVPLVGLLVTRTLPDLPDDLPADLPDECATGPDAPAGPLPFDSVTAEPLDPAPADGREADHG